MESLDLFIDLASSNEIVEGKVRSFASKILNCPPEPLRLLKFTDGTTNTLYRCDGPNNIPKILIRIFGNGTDKIIDRDTELSLMQYLGEKSFTTKVLGRFANGVAYGYTQEIKDHSEQISAELARWHSFDVSAVLGAPKTNLWDRMWSWLSQVPAECHSKTIHEQCATIFNKTALVHEVEELRSLLTREKFDVVFCHNDVQALNCIINEKHIKFIDFEYASYNYRGWDIANHFCEYGGLAADYSLFPDEPTQTEFVKNYLHNLHDRQPSPEDIEQCRIEALKFVPASHLLWVIWALIQAGTSDIDFDYVRYAKLRFDEYFLTKRKYLLYEQ